MLPAKLKPMPALRKENGPVLNHSSALIQLELMLICRHRCLNQRKFFSVDFLPFLVDARFRSAEVAFQISSAENVSEMAK